MDDGTEKIPSEAAIDDKAETMSASMIAAVEKIYHKTGNAAKVEPVAITICCLVVVRKLHT